MRTRALAAVLAVTVAALSAISVVLTVRVGWSFDEAVDGFVISNLVIGLSFGLCGALIAWHRPRHPVGWMYAVGGVCQTLTAAAGPAAQALQNGDASRGTVVALTTVASWAWPVHIAALPLSLYLLPDGRLPSPRWRPLFIGLAVTAPLFVLEVGTSSAPVNGLPDPVWTLPTTGAWGTVWTISEARWSLSMLGGVLALALRYRRGDEAVRRQLLWLLGAGCVVIAAVLPWSLIAGTPIVVLFAIPLLPLAITVAILRYGLFDIRLVVARGLSYGLLTGLVLGGYALLVLALSGVASALLVALLAFPLRTWLQRGVERLLYGDRDPMRVASRVGERLTDLSDSLAELSRALRLPWLAITVHDETVASAGQATEPVVRRQLADGAELIVGLRRGESALAPADARLLDMLAGPLSVALHATLVLRELQQSREQLVAAREEERLRIRRDLHDGLGPLLTGVALTADAAANLHDSAPDEAKQLLRSVRTDTRTAIAEVRRVVDNLRPPVLDQLGLAGALEARAAQTVHRADGQPLTVTVDAALPGRLPPAIEVAAYRIATEALNNVVRHSSASAVVLHVRQADDLVVEVLDDGTVADAWTPGVGMRAMRERAAELGGSCDIGPSACGGSVRARLPLVFA